MPPSSRIQYKIVAGVPYRNEGYYEAYVLNSYARLRPLHCSELYFDFPYEKYIDGKFYECCKTQHKETKAFVPDAAFYATLYPQIILSSLAVLSCTILIFALLVPLVAHLRERSKNDYSSYTLYLVYLAIPDLALNLFILVMYSSYANQRHNIKFNGEIIMLRDPSSTSNVLEGSIIIGVSLTLYCLK